jgi:molybdopterin-guanine dinucleotide biosynthesis protein A
LRILLLGDSVIHGGVQTDHTALASTLLEDSLTTRFHKKIRVLNISAGGWAPDNVAAYIHKFGDFNAKIMVLDVNSLDATDFMTFKKVVDCDPHFPSHKPLSGILEGLQRYAIPKAVLFFTSHFHQQQAPMAPSQTKETAPIKLNAGFSNLYEYAQQHGISFLMVLHPNLSEMSKSAYDQGGQEILRFAKEKRIFIISELDRKPATNLYRDIIHSNEAGQRFLFSELYPVLIEKVSACCPSVN